MLMMEERKMKRYAMLIVVGFCCLIIAFSVALNIFSSREQRGIIAGSIESQLLSTCYAAREVLDEYDFAAFDSPAAVAANEDDYVAMRQELRDLAAASGAEYIYALRYIGGVPEFVLDSDPEDEEIFVPYELSPVHEEAFAGTESAGINNVTDEYGTFHTGAVPVYKNGYVVGIVSVDIADESYNQSMAAATRNNIILVAVLVVTMGVMLAFLAVLLRRLRDLQTKLEKLAHYDNVTGLPNRQYLFDYLKSITANHAGQPFALVFIDLDNFKRVNDNAGHDAGDELLQYIARFLQEQHPDLAKSFRPAAGLLNVSARIGGDEFIQVVPGIDSVEAAGRFAEDLLQRFAEAAASSSHSRYVAKYGVGLSIGVALYPYHSESYHVLIKYADIAMYHAKHAGKNQWQVYREEMEAKDEK